MLHRPWKYKEMSGQLYAEANQYPLDRSLGAFPDILANRKVSAHIRNQTLIIQPITSHFTEHAILAHAVNSLT
jgi:hypothetical protein